MERQPPVIEEAHERATLVARIADRRGERCPGEHLREAGIAPGEEAKTPEAIYSVGPLIGGTGINVTAWSYVDRLCVGMLTCPDLVPDRHALSAGMHAALVELVAAAGGVQRKRASSSG